MNILLILPLCIALYLAGCSGSGSSTTAVATTTVSGTVMAGTVSGAAVTVKTKTGALVAGPVYTDTNGSYTIDVPLTALTSDLIIEATGGTFNDEADQTASGTGVKMGTLSAFVPALYLGSQASLDPSTTIIQRLIAGGMTKIAADMAFGNAFGYNSDCYTRPAFAIVSSASTEAQRRAGFRAAAFSQLTKDLGLAPAKQFELIQALVDDLSDGILDGKKSGIAVTTASGTILPIDIANRFATAMLGFQTSSLNKSKLTTDRIGVLTFSKTALTASYKVEYLPGEMAATQGKTTFKIRITNLSDGTPATGKTITLAPIMHMATMSHTTPVDAVTEDVGTPGTYSCTVYYLMPSGFNIGIWELKAKIGTETAVFYPSVGAKMYSFETLKGVSDRIAAMGGTTENRTYYLFNDGLSGTPGNYTAKIYIAAKESLMSYSAIFNGSQLHDETGAAWTVSPMTVEASTTGNSWVTATYAGNGHWTISGLNLVPGIPGTIMIRLKVNGEQKSEDGFLAGVINGVADLHVTP